MEPLIPDPADYLARNPSSDRAQDGLDAVKGIEPITRRESTGLYSRKHRLPKNCGWLAVEMESIATQLQDAIIAAHGEISIYRSALINEILVHHKIQRLCEWWLIRPHHKKRKASEDPFEFNTTSGIDLKQRTGIVKMESTAAVNRSRAIKELGLDKSKDGQADWATIFAAGAAVGAKAATAIETGKPAGGS